MTATAPGHAVRLAHRLGHQLDIRPINLGTDGDITDGMVAGYLAKYATKATEATGHTSRRLTAETIDLYADPDGTHTQRLVDACWILGRAEEWQRLRNWAHMLGFGGHFLTKSRHYSVTFRLLREERAIWQRTQTAGPEPTEGPRRRPCWSSTSSTSSAPAGTPPATPCSPTPPPHKPANTAAPPARNSPPPWPPDATTVKPALHALAT